MGKPDEPTFETPASSVPCLSVPLALWAVKPGAKRRDEHLNCGDINGVVRYGLIIFTPLP